MSISAFPFTLHIRRPISFMSSILRPLREKLRPRQEAAAAPCGLSLKMEGIAPLGRKLLVFSSVPALELLFSLVLELGTWS